MRYGCRLTGAVRLVRGGSNADLARPTAQCRTAVADWRRRIGGGGWWWRQRGGVGIGGNFQNAGVVVDAQGVLRVKRMTTRVACRPSGLSRRRWRPWIRSWPSGVRCGRSRSIASKKRWPGRWKRPADVGRDEVPRRDAANSIRVLLSRDGRHRAGRSRGRIRRRSRGPRSWLDDGASGAAVAGSGHRLAGLSAGRATN